MYLNISLFRYILLGKFLQDSYQPRVKMRAPGPCKRFLLSINKNTFIFSTFSFRLHAIALGVEIM